MSSAADSLALPAGLLCAQDYARLAAQTLPAPHLAYIAGGSGRDQTTAANRQAFAAWQICPRVMRVLSHGHTRLSLAGQALPHPLLLAPVAHQRLAHAQGELATARGAAASDTLMVCSTLANHRLEAIAEVGPAQRWFQLYLQPRREHTLDLIQRAQAAGYTALMLTLDATIQQPSWRALRAGFVMPPDCVAVNLPAGEAPAPRPAPSGASRILGGLMAAAPNWDDIDWLLRHSPLPLWVKGVLHPDDARALRASGVTGIVVSNHGGRTLDGAPASLSRLAVIRAALGRDYPLLLDGGIRSGADVFKALALGANAVMVGRLQLYALAAAGALGVAHLIKLLREELELCMAQAGCATLADIGPDCLLPTPRFAPAADDADLTP